MLADANSLFHADNIPLHVLQLTICEAMFTFYRTRSTGHVLQDTFYRTRSLVKVNSLRSTMYKKHVTFHVSREATGAESGAYRTCEQIVPFVKTPIQPDHCQLETARVRCLIAYLRGLRRNGTSGTTALL